MGNSDLPPAISGAARSSSSAGNDAACRESRASARAAAVGRARLIARGSDDVLKITSDLAA